MRFANLKTEMSSSCVRVQHLCLFLQIEKATFTVTLATRTKTEGNGGNPGSQEWKTK